MNWKQILSIVAAAALILGIGSVILTPSAQAQTAVPTTVPTVDSSTVREVTASGFGQANIEPDTALVLVGVQTDAQTATQTLMENNQQIQKVLNALKQAGVAERDLQTQTVQLTPKINNNNGATPAPSQTLTGFTALNIVQVTVRNLANLGALLDAAVGAGGNTIQYISFSASNPTSTLDQARQAAMADARHKAEQLAALTNSSVGEVIRISETSDQPRALAAEAPGNATGGASVPVLPGMQTVSVEIQVTWQLIRGTASIPVSGLTPTRTSPQTSKPTSTVAVITKPTSAPSMAATSVAPTIEATSLPGSTTTPAATP